MHTLAFLPQHDQEIFTKIPAVPGVFALRGMREKNRTSRKQPTCGAGSCGCWRHRSRKASG